MNSNKLDSLQFNRHVFSITSLTDEDMENKTYWLQKKPCDQLIALEYLRQVMYNYDPNTTRLQRVFEIAQFPPS